MHWKRGYVGLNIISKGTKDSNNIRFIHSIFFFTMICIRLESLVGAYGACISHCPAMAFDDVEALTRNTINQESVSIKECKKPVPLCNSLIFLLWCGIKQYSIVCPVDLLFGASAPRRANILCIIQRIHSQGISNNRHFIGGMLRPSPSRVLN